MFDPRKVDVMKTCQLIYTANQITVFYITAILLLNVLMILQKANIFNTPRLSTILNIKWDKVFKNGPSKICGRQPLKNVRQYGLL